MAAAQAQAGRNPLSEMLSNPAYDALLVRHMGTGNTGALTKLYTYHDDEKRERLVARVYWEPGGHTPEYLDAAEIRRTGTQSGLFGESVPYYEEGEQRKTEGGHQTSLGFRADDDFRLTPRTLTEEEERATNRGRLRADLAQGRMFNPGDVHVPCRFCGQPLTVRPHASRLRCGECNALMAVERR